MPATQERETVWYSRIDKLYSPTSKEVSVQEVSRIRTLVKVLREVGGTMLNQAVAGGMHPARTDMFYVVAASSDRRFSASVSLPRQGESVVGGSSTLMVRDNNLPSGVRTPIWVSRLDEKTLGFGQYLPGKQTYVEVSDQSVEAILRHLNDLMVKNEVNVQLVKRGKDIGLESRTTARPETIKEKNILLASRIQIEMAAEEENELAPYLEALRVELGQGVEIERKAAGVEVRYKEGEKTYTRVFGLPNIAHSRGPQYVQMTSLDGEMTIFFKSDLAKNMSFSEIEIERERDWHVFVQFWPWKPNEAVVNLGLSREILGFELNPDLRPDIRMVTIHPAMLFFKDMRRIQFLDDHVMWIRGAGIDDFVDVGSGVGKNVDEIWPETEELAGRVYLNNSDNEHVILVIRQDDRNDNRSFRNFSVVVRFALADFGRRVMAIRAIFKPEEFKRMIEIS